MLTSCLIEGVGAIPFGSLNLNTKYMWMVLLGTKFTMNCNLKLKF